MSDASTWTAANNRQWRWRFWRALFPFSSPLLCLPPLLGLRNIGGPSWGCWTFPPKAFFYPHERKISQFCYSETRYKVGKAGTQRFPLVDFYPFCLFYLLFVYRGRALDVLFFNIQRVRVQSEALTPRRPRDGQIGETDMSLSAAAEPGWRRQHRGQVQGGIKAPQPPVFNQRSGWRLRLHADGGAVKGTAEAAH